MSGARRRAPHPRRGRGDAPEVVQASREVAFRVLRAVESDDAYANLLLPAEIERAGLSAGDAALATELTYGTLRGRGMYDAIIELASGREVSAIDAGVLDALRLGAHQLLATRVASHAAVNEAVVLARRASGRGAAGFANAVLRRISRDTPGEWHDAIVAAARSDDEALGRTTSHPVWIVRALRRSLAAEGRADELDELLAADNSSPAVTMAALPDLAEPVPPRTPFSPIGFRAPAGDPEGLVRASRGAQRVQDEGSQLVALALARLDPVHVGERWLDLCAGPGGKTALLAAEARTVGAHLEANEVVPARAGLVRRALEAVPGDVPVHERDGRELARENAGEFDRILVDAPCTGLGALRRRPEARWRKRPDDVGGLAALQEELLDAAVEALAPGGIVAYVTCSPHLAETSAVVRTVVERRGDAVEMLDAPAALQAVSRERLELGTRDEGLPVAQLWPHRHGTDAMFLALLRRR
ncbi:RsmB/NOP family class I SAM-dependent RNA methyltransferase [Microbacterium suaedae]|uniref:RsmB/NOP family class I SAM-dependent RNA methyltransferase n=1 Tax=Microbacterium suaedae TaxID=2067813 RepID=UPI000DA16881|nr:transcription antitermination factor NusB [Microbacterium suaedae]